MNDPEVDLLFRRFRADGDPRAIAALYDRVAPELLLIASHLGTRGGDAEDLLQATFLAVIESAPTFDPSRRFMPWLVGILVNQARRQRRWRGRHPDPQRLAQSGDADPAGLAEAGEFAAELSRQLDQLAPHYRQVLTLRWVHGLTPQEIAHALGLPPDTVKTRLRRGQDILRRALPAGFAAGLFLLPQVSLASVRERIIAHATQQAATRTAADRTGPAPRLARTTPSNAASTVIAGLLLVSVAALLILRTPRDHAAGAGTPMPPHPAATTTAQTAPIDDRTGRSPTPARAAAPVISPDSPIERCALSVTLLYHDGDPATGAAVRADREGAADPLLCERWVVADAQGIATFAELEPGAWRLTADRGGSAACTLAAGIDHHVTVHIPPGIDLIGRVVDEGQPVADAQLWLSRDDVRDEGHGVARTGGDGRFWLRSITPGRLLSVIASGHTARPLEPIEGTPGERREIEFDLRPLRSGLVLAGCVTDDAGSPLRARVQIGQRLPLLDFTRAVTTRRARTAPLVIDTDAEGRFEVRGLLLWQRQVEVFARAQGFAPVHATVSVVSQRSDLTLRLRRGLEMTGRVTDGAGKPLAGVRVRARDPAIEEPSFAPRWADAVTFTAADGSYNLPGVPPGETYLLATAADGRRLSAVIDAPANPRFDVMLQPLRSLAGVVMATDGQPLADLAVRALVPRGRIEPTPARTDANGRFTIDNCEDLAHALWIDAPNTPWNGVVAARPGVRPATSTGDPIQVIVPRENVPSASIVGRIVDADGSPCGARLGLESLTRSQVFANVDATTGVFRIGPVPALLGGYLLYAETATGALLTRADIRPAPGQTLDLGDLVARPPAHLILTARRTDGSPVDGCVITAPAGGPPLDALQLRQGRAERTNLTPGPTCLHLRDEHLGLIAQTIDLAAGVTTRLELVADPGAPVEVALIHPPVVFELAVDIAWCDASGAVLCRDRLRFGADEPWRLRQALAPGSYLLRADSQVGLHAETTIDVLGTTADPATTRLVFHELESSPSANR